MNDSLLGLAPTLQGHFDILPVNQSTAQSEHQSSSLCNQCIHIIDRLQQHLQPDHTATLNIYTKHRDQSHLLHALSPQTNRQLSLRLSTTQTFNIQQRLHRRDTTTAIYTPIHILYKIFSIKPGFKLIHLPLSFVQSSVNQKLQHTTYSRDRRIQLQEFSSKKINTFQLHLL